MVHRGALRSKWEPWNLQVMIDGGMMSLPTCEEALASCTVDASSNSGCCANSRLVTTERGPCYRVQPDSRDQQPDHSGDANLGAQFNRKVFSLRFSFKKIPFLILFKGDHLGHLSLMCTLIGILEHAHCKHRLICPKLSA